MRRLLAETSPWMVETDGGKSRGMATPEIHMAQVPEPPDAPSLVIATLPYTARSPKGYTSRRIPRDGQVRACMPLPLVQQTHAGSIAARLPAGGDGMSACHRGRRHAPSRLRRPVDVRLCFLS